MALESQELSSSHPVPAVGEFVPAGQSVPLSFHQPPSPSLVLEEPLQLPALHRSCRDELTHVSPSCGTHTSGSAVGTSPWLVERWEIHSKGTAGQAVRARAGRATEQKDMQDAQGG